MKYKLNKNFTSLEAFAKNIRDEFLSSHKSIHKARNEIKPLTYNEKTYIVKSFKIPNLLRKAIYTFFKPSKAKKTYINSLRVQEFTPTPIAYVEFYKCKLLHKSYFINEEYRYDFLIAKPLFDKNFPNREQILKDFAIFTSKLHDKNIYHLDYSPGNILIKKLENGYEFKIVDINRMKFFTLDIKMRMKNFAKLWASDDDLTIIAKEYARFKNKDEKECIAMALKYSKRHKAFINFKKRLRGRKVVD